MKEYKSTEPKGKSTGYAETHGSSKSNSVNSYNVSNPKYVTKENPAGTITRTAVTNPQGKQTITDTNKQGQTLAVTEMQGGYSERTTYNNQTQTGKFSEGASDKFKNYVAQNYNKRLTEEAGQGLYRNIDDYRNTANNDNILRATNQRGKYEDTGYRIPQQLKVILQSGEPNPINKYIQQQNQPKPKPQQTAQQILKEKGFGAKIGRAHV